MDCNCCARQGEGIKIKRFIKRKMRTNLFCRVCMQLTSRQISTRAAITAFERFKFRFIHFIVPQALFCGEDMRSGSRLQCKWDNLRFTAKTILNEEISLKASHMKVQHIA